MEQKFQKYLNRFNVNKVRKKFSKILPNRNGRAENNRSIKRIEISVAYRTGYNLVDQLHNILISEPCEEGTYRDSSMTSCEKCDAGKEPNTDKTGCGKTFYD